MKREEDLNIVFQAPDQLPVHLSCLSHSDTAALGLAQAVLQDATGLVGLLQLQPQLLQLVHLLLLEHVTHFQHLAAKLLDLILGKTARNCLFQLYSQVSLCEINCSKCYCVKGKKTL